MTTTKPNIQIDDLVREMTDEEYAAHNLAQESAAATKAEVQAKADARTSALAKLAKLGFTKAEIEAL